MNFGYKKLYIGGKLVEAEQWDWGRLLTLCPG